MPRIYILRWGTPEETTLAETEAASTVEAHPDLHIFFVDDDVVIEYEGPLPPVPKYTYTVTITGNSHEEIEKELLYLTRGGYLLDSEYHKRDRFKVYGGRKTSELKHTNPDMTPERYDEELSVWWDKRKEWKKQKEKSDGNT